MLKTRVITALILVGLLIAALYIGRATFVLAAAVLFAGAVFEWQRLAGLPRALCVASAVAVVGVLVTIELLGRSPVGAALTLVSAGAVTVWATLLAVLLRAEHGGIRVGRPVIAMLGFTLLPAAWMALLYLHQRGVLVLFSAMAIVWVADIAAYFAGRAFGKTKLAPHISPGKTWAGVGGALVGVLGLGTIAYLMAPQLPLFSNVLFKHSFPLALVVLAVLVAVSIVGDLFESLLKRQAGMKDSGHLLPGHGGVLDRIDALLPVLPAAVLLERWIR